MILHTVDEEASPESEPASVDECALRRGCSECTETVGILTLCVLETLQLRERRKERGIIIRDTYKKKKQEETIQR